MTAKKVTARNPKEHRQKKARQGVEYEDVDASPVKEFFVSMLTRDISLTDSILDLLDNCIDGILRKKRRAAGLEPYKNFYAEIGFDKHTFSISDNCGGIPWDLHEYAFRMGRSDANRDSRLATVGVYGIGMKRAIFKMGEQCLISTKSGEDNYEVEITPQWIADEVNWKIPVRQGSKGDGEDGTTIVIGELHEGIKATFGIDRDSFEKDFRERIATHYAFIIKKGFSVSVNGRVVDPKPTELIFSKNGAGIKPFIYRTKVGDVEIFLAVGFTRPIPSEDEVVDELEETRFSALDAGWTILCNDRAVVYCDKSELTGWGQSNVPRYHNQFIAISGIVEFRSNDAKNLPMTTTKRGIDASSSIYLQVKNKMMEGMRVFTDYTNKWKSDVEASKKHMRETPTLTFQEIKKGAEKLKFSAVRGQLKGEQYKPKLPQPATGKGGRRRISFARPDREVRVVADYLFDNEDVLPSKVGEECFERLLRESER